MTDDLYLTREERKKLSARLTDVIEWLADELDNTITRQAARSDRAPRSQAAETPVNFHEPAARAAETLHACLGEWTEHVCTYATPTWPGRQRITGYAAWLNRHLIDLSKTPEAPQALHDIDLAVSRALRIIDLPTPTEFAGPCQSDDTDTQCDGVYARPDTTTWQCGTCQITCDIPALREASREALTQRLYTDHDLASALSILTGTEVRYERIRNWVRRDKLDAAGTDRDGNSLYRLTDAVALMNRTSKGRAS